MKKFFLLIIALLVFSTASFAQTHVDGYYKKDGTYVKPHFRSTPDGSFDNNWSSKGNVNPYTGKKGYKKPKSIFGK